MEYGNLDVERDIFFFVLKKRDMLVGRKVIWKTHDGPEEELKHLGAELKYPAAVLAPAEESRVF